MRKERMGHSTENVRIFQNFSYLGIYVYVKGHKHTRTHTYIQTHTRTHTARDKGDNYYQNLQGRSA